MMHHDLKKLAQSMERTGRIIWFAFMVAPVGYAAVAWFATSGGTKDLGHPESNALLYGLVFVGFMSAVVLPWFVFPRFVGVKQILRQSPTSPQSFRGQNGELYRRLSEEDQQKALVVGAIQQSMIMRWACVESVAVYGLLALLVGYFGVYAVWAVCFVSIAYLACLRPDYVRDLERHTKGL